MTTTAPALHSPAAGRGRSRAASRGSLLIVAMIFSSVLGIAITSYIQLARSNLKVSSRAFYNNAGVNLAETGLEEAMWSINQAVDGNAAAWDDWVRSGSNAARKWTGYAFDQNASGMIRVWVQNYTGVAAPTIVARASVNVVDGAPIEKWIEVRLRKRSKFANGLVAKDSISFSGNNASVDSWNSDPDGLPGTPPVPYSAAVRLDNGSVGSISVAVDAVLVQNADIWGYAATGGALPSVGANGLVGPFGTASGTMDMNRVSTDFSADFDPVAAPAGSYYVLGGITNTLTLPRLGDSPAADGKYYYEATQVSFNNRVLTIADNVILKLTDPVTSIAIGGGSGELRINLGSKVEIYAPGDISIAGNGIFNGGSTAATANQPASCQIWGTKTTGTQNIAIAGNGVLSAVVYAPQGAVKINGNGDVCGSVVANNINVVGNAAFHYDEALANMDTGNPYGITSWRELTSAADRATYLAQLSF
jgi:Tfp pilus assembly protein PilX